MSKIDKIVDGVKDAVLEGLKGAQKIIDNYEFNGNNITININEKLVSKELASQFNDAIRQVEGQLKRTDIDLSNIYFDNKKVNAKNIMNDYVRDLLAIDVSKGQVDEEINGITRNIEYTSQQLKQTLDDYSVELFESANRYSSVIDKINSERMKSNIRYNGDSSKYTKELNILENYNEQEFIDFYNLFDDYRNGMKEFSDLYSFRPSKDNKDKFLDFARNLSYTDMRYSENKDLNTYTTLLEQGVLGDTKDLSDLSVYLDSIIRKLNEISDIKINFGDMFQTEAFANFNLAIREIASGLSSLNNDFRKVNNLDIIDAQAQKVAGAKDKLLYTKSGKINEGKVNKKNIQNYIKEYDKYLQMSNKEAFFEDNQNSQILKKYYDEFKNQDIKDVEASARKLRETLSEGADFSFFKTLIKSINTLGGNQSAEKINAITENLEKLQSCIKSLDFSNPSFNELNQILANADVLRTAFKTQKTAETKAKKANYPNEYKQFISGQKDFQNIDDEQYDYFKNKFSKEYTSNLSKLDKKIQTSPYSEQIAKFKNQYSDMYNQFSNLDDVEDGLNSMKQMTASWNEFWNSLSSTKSNSKIESIISQMTTFKNGNPKIGKENIAVIDSLIDSLRSLKGELGNGNEYNEIVEKFFSLKSAMTDQGKTGDSFFGKMGSEWVRGTTQLLKNYFGIMDIIRYGREAIQVVTELDTALTELRKVSDASSSELATMFQRASDTAQELGSTVSDVINAQADWSRMGYNLDESDELARVSTIYKNVGDGISQEEANESLISTLQGFRMTADESMDIIDKFNEVSNNYAISSGGIGEALQRSAASFTAANTDLSKAIALVTTSNTVVQNPETVGTAFKSMSARLRGATTELEEMGEAEDGVTNTTAKLQSLVKGLTGFDIMEDDKKTFKDIYDIMVGIGEQWDNLTDVEQASLSEALFGKRNSNIGFSVLQNIDTLKSVYKTAEESQGSALKEQERYNESIQAHINQTKASLQELLYKAIDSGLIKDLLDAGKGVLDFLTAIIDKVGLLNTLLPVTAGILGGKNSGKVNGFVGDLFSGNLKWNTYEQSEGMRELMSEAQKNVNKGLNGLEFLEKYDLTEDRFKTLSQFEKEAVLNVENLNEASLSTLQSNLQKTGTIAGRVSGAFKTLGATLKAAAMSFAAMAIIEVIASALSDLFDGMEALTELNENIGTDTEDITSNTEKVSELIDVINSESSTVEEIANARKELLSIQDKLNEKYGTEVDLLKEAKKYSNLNFSGRLYDTSDSYLNNLYPQETTSNIELSNIEKANGYIQGLRQYIENMDETTFSLDRIVGESINETNADIESVKNAFQDFGDDVYRELYTIGGYYSDFYDAIDDLGNDIRNFINSTDLMQKYSGDLFSFVRDGFQNIINGYLEDRQNITQAESNFIEKSFDTVIDNQLTQSELDVRKSEYAGKLVESVGEFAEGVVDNFVDAQATEAQLSVTKSQFIADTTNRIAENIRSVYVEADAYAQRKANEVQDYFFKSDASDIFNPSSLGDKTPFQKDLDALPGKISDFVDDTIEQISNGIEIDKNNARTVISNIKSSNRDFFSGKLFKDYLLNGIDSIQSAFNSLTTEIEHSTGDFGEEADRLVFNPKTGVYQYKSQLQEQREGSNVRLDISQEENMVKYLSVVQSDLVKQYGDTAKSLDLFKNSSNGAAEALNDLAVAASEKKISDYLASGEGTGLEHIGTVIATYWGEVLKDIGEPAGSKTSNYEAISKSMDFNSTDVDLAVDRISSYTTSIIDGIGQYSGNAYAIQEQLKELKKKYPENRDLAKEYSNVTNLIAQYGELAKAQLQINLRDNAPLKALLSELEDAKNDYSSIKQSSGEDSKEAQVARSRMLEEYYIATKGGLEGISKESIDYLKTLYPELENEISSWKFEVDFANKSDSEKDKTTEDVNNALDTYIKANALEGKSQEDIIKAYNAQKESINNFNENWASLSSAEKERYIDRNLSETKDFLGKDIFEKLYGDETIPRKERMSALVEEIDKIYFGFNALDSILNQFGITIEKLMGMFGFGAGVQTQEQQTAEFSVQTAFRNMPGVSSNDVKWYWNATNQQERDAIGKNVSGFTSYVEQYRQSGDDLETAWSKALVDIETKADATFSEIASKMQKNLKDLDSLGSIYSDVQDGGDFDWSKLLNNEDFNKTFGSMGNVYSDFVKTVSDNPADISATQDAFNNLVNTWMMSKGVLDGLTAETKANVVAQMEQAGITNAEAIATNTLAAQEQYLAEKKQYANELYSQRISLSGSLDEATMNDAACLVHLQGGLDATNSAMVSYIIQKQTASGTFLDESSNITQLQFLANAAMSAAASVQALNSVMGAISTASKSSVTDASWQFGSTENYYADAFAELGYDKTYVIGKRKGELDQELQFIKGVRAQSVLDEMKAKVSDFSFTPTYAPPVVTGGGSGGSGGSGGGSGGGGGSTSDNNNCTNANNDSCTKAEEKVDSCTTIDHFETKIKRLEREIENLDKIASHTFIGWQERNNKLGDSFWKLSNELQTQCSGMWMYLDKANSVPLDDFHKNLINNGCTSIETFADDNLKKLIDEYQEWYEKALDCADAIEEIKDKQAEVFSQQFDNVGKQYDQLIERVESANEKLDLWIENQETRGKFVANSYYATQIDNEKKRFMNLQEQLKKQQDLMNCSVNQGAVQLFSEQWYEMNNAIMETDNELQKTVNTIDELNNKMRENNWDIFDKKMEWKEMLEEESNFLIDALSRDELYNENGTFNEGGISVAGMRAVNFDYNMARAQDYKKAISEVEAEMKKLDYTDQNLVDRRNELLKLQQDSIKAALDEKDAIKDLVKEGYDKLVSYLDKLTGKYKQTLRAQKDLYDYEKSIRKQTEAISDYSKQLMALEGDDSEENKARLQQLRQNLKDAEEELEDTEYNKWLEDQESMLDDMMSDLEEWVEEKLTHTDEIIQEQIDAINDSKDVISETINNKADDLGYSLTEAMDGIINNNCTAYDLASDFHGEFTNEWNRTLDYLKSIDETVDEMRSRTCTESSDNRGCTSMVNNGVANNGCSSADQFQSWVDMKPLNPQNECTSQQNNGCSQQPQNNGCSQPQNNGCTQPQNNGCSQQQNNACTPQNDDCTRNNSCSNYATGRRKGNKELAWTQEKGQEAIYRKSDGALLTPLGNGDKVFTNAQTEALWNMSKGLNPTALPSVAKVNNNIKTGDSNVVFEGDINVVGVTNPREFSEQLRNAINNDEKVKKTLQANTLGVAVGKNSLLGNSIK